MKTLPKHFQLHSEEPTHYVIIDTRDNKTFPVAKHALDLETHAKLSKIKRFESGGKVQSDSAGKKDKGTLIVSNIPDLAGDYNSGASWLNSNPPRAATPSPQPSPIGTTVQNYARGGAVRHYDEGTPDEPVEADDSQGSGDEAPTPPVTVNVNSAPMAPAIQPPPVAAVPVAAPAAAPLVRIPPAMPAGAPLVRQAQAAQALTERGAQEQATAEAQASAADAQALQDHTTKMQALMDGVAEKRKALDTENAQLTQAVMNQDIDPNHYWHNKSLPGKISTAIGVILGGIGAGLQHSTTNQAMEVVQNAIRQDVEAQKANLGKKQSLLSMNLEKYRNLDAATSATIAQMNAMVEGQLKLNAAKSGSQRAQAAADLAIGTNRMKYITELPSLAMADYKASLLNGGSSGPSAAQRILNPNAEPQAGSPMLDAMRSKAGVSAPAQTQQGTVKAPPPLEPDILTPDQIDLNRIGHLKAAGVIDDKDFDKLREEIGDVKQRDQTNRFIKSQFDQMQDAMNKSKSGPVRSFLGRATAWAGPLAIDPAIGSGTDLARAQETLEGVPLGIGKFIKGMPTWGGAEGSKFVGSRNALLLQAPKLLGDRATPEVLEKLRATLPEGQEGPEEMQNKFERFRDIINMPQKIPTLDTLDKVYNITSRKK